MNNNRGKWYLVYKDMFDTDIRMGMSEYATFEYERDKEIPLIAKTKDKAILEARIMWTNMLAEATAIWEEVKKKAAHPPKTAFGGADPNPYVIYKIKLE